MARRLGVPVGAVRAALHGEGPYKAVHRPSPISDTSLGARPVLTPAQVREARRLRRQGAWMSEIAERLDSSLHSVREAVHGRSPYEGIDRPGPIRDGRPRVRPSLSEAQVAELRQRVTMGARLRDLARAYDVSLGTLTGAAYGHPPYDRFRSQPPASRPRKGPQAEMEWEYRRKVALSCTTWGEFGKRLGLAYPDPSIHRAHGVRLLCAICRTRPSSTTIVRLPPPRPPGRPFGVGGPSRVAACLPCVRARGAPPAGPFIERGQLRRAGELAALRMARGAQARAAESLGWARYFEGRGVEVLPRLSDSTGWMRLRRKGMPKRDVDRARAFLRHTWKAGRPAREKSPPLGLPVAALRARAAAVGRSLRDPESLTRDPSFLAKWLVEMLPVDSEKAPARPTRTRPLPPVAIRPSKRISSRKE